MVDGYRYIGLCDFFEVFDAGDIYEKVMIGCQLELETVSGEGYAPEIPVVSRRESMMIELTKHIFCWLYM